MAQPKQPEPTPPPPPPPAPTPGEVTRAAQKEVKNVKAGIDPMRPAQYAYGFVAGTVRHTLDDMALWGRKGSYIGVGLGILMMFTGGALIAVPALVLPVAGWVAGLGGGAVLGGAYGLLTGGKRGVDLEMRKVKYKDDLVAKESGPGHHQQVDYRDDLRDYHLRTNYLFDRIAQQDYEVKHQVRDESRGFFQEMVHHSRSGPHEHGV